MTPLIPLFAYGTLRADQGNYSWTSDCVIRTDLNCTTTGRIYFVSTRMGYPVAKLDEDGTIFGDVLWCDPDHKSYDDIMRMELGAGYEVREIDAYTTECNLIECIAFHYRYDPWGDLIASGDWVKERQKTQ